MVNWFVDLEAEIAGTDVGRIAIRFLDDRVLAV
jgi:hypothetical protein